MTAQTCTIPNCGRPAVVGRPRLCGLHRADYLAHRREVSARARKTAA